MSENGNNQVFYAKSPKRWQHYKRTISTITVFLVSIFSITLGSIFFEQKLPLPGLSNENKNFKSVPATAGATIPPKAIPGLSQNLSLKKQTTGTVSNPRVLGYYVNWDDNSLSSLKDNIQNIDELVPEWLHLGDPSNLLLVDDQGVQDTTIKYIEQARPTLPIVPLIDNYNNDTQRFDTNRLSAALATPDSRTALVNALLNYVRQNKFSGISIDFENLTDHQQASMTAFMQELYGQFHPLNLEVSQNIPLDDNSYDAKTLSQYSDFLILMAYDEHAIDDTTAGPIASQNWFISSLNARLKEVPLNKYVIALGAYGYDWMDKEKSGSNLSFQDAMTLAKNAGATVTLDPTSLNPTFSYTDDKNKLHHVWFLNAATTFNEMEIGKKLGGPYGYAFWYIGSEDPSVWQVVANRDKLDQSVTNNLKTVRYGYGISYVNQGEILRVTSTPHIGSRALTYDTKTGFITEEKMSDFPSPYVITRWGGEASNKKKIVLTFDDGPDQNYTPQILSILKKYNVPATFFVIGANANFDPKLLKQEYLDGNEIGNHTYTHPDITKISDFHLMLELDANQRLIEAILGHETLLFRPPYAEDIEPDTVSEVYPLAFANSADYYTVAMHIDPSDWSSPGVDTIVKRVMDSAKSGAGNVVLLHDGGGDRSQTVAALPQIIEGLQGAGFQIVSVANLIGTTGDKIMPITPAKDQFLVKISYSAVMIAYWFSLFMHFMFFTGIVLGIMRFLFIGTLAVIQWAHDRRGKYKDFELTYRPTVSVIIPAFNEEKVIVKTIRAILNSTYPNLEVIVVDDGSNDRTYQKAVEIFGYNPQVQIFTQANSGKSQALNFGIAKTNAEIIITLDADTVFSPSTIGKLVRKFADRRIWAVAGNAKVGNRINLLTRWQALEYITSQNLDRRAFEMMNCITVVPGAVGAWKRQAIMEAGGFSSDTLAEDTDLTFNIIKHGHLVAYDDEAIAYTEAPDTTKNFIKQRFRWMYGTLQTIWKYRDVWGKKKYGALGLFSVPNVLLFQIVFPLVSPLMDLMMVFSIIWVAIQNHYHPIDYSSLYGFQKVFFYYILFLLIDLVTATIPFFLERKEKWSLIIWLPLQRFYYRQLMYYVAIKAFTTMVRGKTVGWGKFERKATVTETA